MLKSDLVQTDKHSIKILLRRKNLRFLRRTNLIKTRCTQFEKREMELINAIKYEKTNIYFDNFDFIIKLPY